MSYVGREDLAAGLWMAAQGRDVIFFRVIDGLVRIERALHGARNLPVVLGNQGGATSLRRSATDQTPA